MGKVSNFWISKSQNDSIVPRYGLEFKTSYLRLCSLQKSFFHKCTEQQADVEEIVDVDVDIVDMVLKMSMSVEEESYVALYSPHKSLKFFYNIKVINNIVAE